MMGALILAISPGFGLRVRWRRWLRMVLGLMVASLLAGCAGNPSASAGGAENSTASFGPGYPPGSAAWDTETRSAYRTAFLAGMQDQKEGFRYDDERGAAVLDIEVRGFYRQGYRRGYYHEQNLRRQERKEVEQAAETENE
jgi:hypothetical protein